MGRRPNQLVSEFFYRGHKLEDASNRYEHTCKRCGEVFSKGRVDGLMNHILRRCPNVTQQQRDLIAQQNQQTERHRGGARSNDFQRPIASDSSPFNAFMPNNPTDQVQQSYEHFSDAPPNHEPIQSMSLSHEPAPIAETSDVRNTNQMIQGEMPFELFQQLQQSTALDTLAEVSRRHLDYSSQRPQHSQEQTGVNQDEGRAIAEQALLAQLHNAGVTSGPRTEGLCAYATNTAHDGQTFAGAPSTTTGIAPTPLVETASAANHQLDNHHTQGFHELSNASLDPHLGHLEAQLTAHLGHSLNSSESQFQTGEEMMWNPTTSSGTQAFMNMSGQHTDDMPAFGFLHRSAKSKGRNKFSDNRRKQVQTIRKQGACMRCRMLKKPCSEGTPCLTCQSVESARLWKGTCVRTKVVEEFTLWSTSLFHSFAINRIPGATHGLAQTAIPGRMEVRFCGQSDLAMTFSCKQYSNSPHSEQIIAPTASEFDETSEEPRTIWLLDETENIIEKIGEYIQQVGSVFIEEEDSPFMRVTLQQAQTLVQTDDVASTNRNDTQTGRACYNLETQLLAQVFDLWVMTRILAAPHDSVFEMRYNETEMPQQEPSAVQWSMHDSPSTIRIPSSAPTHDLIKHQLLAMIEARSSKLSKKILNELERRLLQRQQVSKFATFISAAILLNCVERLTGFFRAFDLGSNETNGDASDYLGGSTSTNEYNTSSWGTTTYQSSSPTTPSWPLTEPPSKYWDQGEPFASLLIILLRMRALPPKTMQTGEGNLVTVLGYGLPVQTTSRTPRTDGNSEEQTRLASNWLDPMFLRADEWITIRDKPAPGPEAGVKEWDMRFISCVLLPEGT